MSRLVAAAVLGALALPTLVFAPAGAPDLAFAAASTAPARAACSAGDISLTFDDGPSSSQTPRLIRILRAARVPATFFMVGSRVDAAPEVARLVASSGFLVANHSYRHEAMTGQSSAAIRATLAQTQRSLSHAGLRPTRLMRPPYGAIDTRVRTAVTRAKYVPVLWDVDPRDWEGGSSATIAARILAQLRPRRSNVVLQHDGVGNSPASIAAVPRVIREARRRGYCFVALDEAGEPGFPVPRASLRVSGAPEGRSARAVVTLDRPTARTTSVRLVTRSGSALATTDFAGRAVVVRFPAGSLRQEVQIPIVRDRLDEADERFTVRLLRPRHLVVRRGVARVDIIDHDPAPTVSARDATIEEPPLDSVVLDVRVRLARVSGKDVLLRVVDVPGSATAGADYEPVDEEFVIPAGTRWVTLPVRVNADLEPEGDEEFQLRITTARGARLVRPESTVTITAPPPTPPPPAPSSKEPSPQDTNTVANMRFDERIRRHSAI